MSPPYRKPVADRRRQVLDHLRDRSEGWRCAELARELGVGRSTAKRDLQALASEHPEEVYFDRSSRTWRLGEAALAYSLDRPEVDDLNAVLIARTILGGLLDRSMAERLDRLAEQIDDRLGPDQPRTQRVPAGAVTASLTLGTPIEPGRLRLILAALGRQVLAIDYGGTWNPGLQSATFEPWHLRIHDGSLYLRGYWREKLGPRTLRVAKFERVEVIDGARPEQTRPHHDQLWGTGDPALGIDHHFPGEARIVVEGGLARWIAPMLWHPYQRDRWLVSNECLERRVKYRSRREMARRLLGILDGLREVEPAELKHELVDLLRRSTLSEPFAKPTCAHP